MSNTWNDRDGEVDIHVQYEQNGYESRQLVEMFIDLKKICLERVLNIMEVSHLYVNNLGKYLIHNTSALKHAHMFMEELQTCNVSKHVCEGV